MENRVSELLDREHEKTQELRNFSDKLFVSYQEAERSARRNITLFLVSWMTLSFIDLGFVSEGSISSFRIEKINSLLIAGPPLIATSQYLTAASVTTAGRIRVFFEGFYERNLPAAYDTGLYLLIGPPGIIATERFLSLKNHSTLFNLFKRAWVFCLALALPVGSVVSLIHVCHMAYTGIESNAWIAILSIALGILIWARSLLIWWDFDP